MESELESQLQGATRQQLLTLVRELALRHPQLHTEMSELLAYASSLSSHSILLSEPNTISKNDIDDREHIDADMNNVGDETNDIEEEWDFSGNEPLSLHKIQQQGLQAINLEEYRQRLAEYAQRLQHGESPQSLFEDLNTILEEAEVHAEQHDYQSAIDLYALVLDERLDAVPPDLVHLLDKGIDDVMPILETVLSEVSSNILFDSSSLTPLMSLETRQQWLERLFALWLKRLDVHRMEEDLPEIILDVAWSEDILLLRSLVQNELQKQPHSEHSNIVDFTRQYRTKALEKFLKELPRT